MRFTTNYERPPTSSTKFIFADESEAYENGSLGGRYNH